ncbi:NEAT domain-containing protein, partial [Brochothrix thermosphacta]
KPTEPGKPTEPSKPTKPSKPAPVDPLKLKNNHQYTVNFKVLKEKSTELSMMDGYTQKPAVIKVEKNQAYAYVTLKNSHWIKTFETKQNGKFVAAQVVSKDAKKDTRVVKYPVKNAADSTEARTHVKITDVPGLKYDNVYKITVKLDGKSIKDVTTTKPVLPVKPQPPVKPTTPVKPSKPVTPVKPSKPVTPVKPSQPVKTAVVNPNKLQEGKSYSTNFTILKENSNAVSMMDSYTQKPAIIKVEQGQAYLYLTLTNSHWIKTFETKQNGKFIAAQVVSKDTKKDTRVVKYKIPNGAAATEARTHVKIDDVPGLDYDNYYNVTVKLDPKTLTDTTGKKVVQLAVVTNANNTSGTGPNGTANTVSTLAQPNNNAGAALLKPTFAKAEQAPIKQTAATKQQNVKTGDKASMFIYGLFVILASGYFIRRFQVRNR